MHTRPVENELSLVQELPGRRKGFNLFPETMLAYFAKAYICN